MAAATRSSAEVWLVGKATNHFSSARLATKGDAIRCLLFYHLDEHLTVKDSIHRTVKDISIIWSKARIPTQRIDSGERQLKKLYNEYQLLKVNRTKENESCRIKEQMFKDYLMELFDLATKNALDIMTNNEDKQFLTMQREDVTSSSMAGVDRNLAEKEAKKRARIEANENRKLKETEKLQQIETSGPALDISSSSKSEDDVDDEDFRVPSSSSAQTPTSKPKRLKSLIATPEVAGALDRVNLPDRGAMFVVASVAKALGHPLDDLTLSRSTIRRSRMVTRKLVAEAEKGSFSTEFPLLLHWDGKLLPDIAGTGAKKTVDRIAVIVTGNGIEKLLAVPKIGRGTGEEQAAACLKVLDDWNIKEQVQGLVFDTTSSNTGIHRGACVLIEKTIGHELVNIGCRHHVLEVVLSSVFTAVFGGTGGPEVALFKRFQKKWPYIRQTEYSPAKDEIFNEDTETLRKEMVIFYTKAIGHQQPREDYLELLRLCLVFLGGNSLKMDFQFRTPGAMHHARWMSKAIYSLKMVLFEGQMELTAKEKRGLKELALFVSLIYGRFWHEAPLASHAPLNDATMLGLLKRYPNRIIADAAYTAFTRHLWFFSEHLVGLAFFDDRVSLDVKRAMVANLQLPKTGTSGTALKRISTCGADVNSLESFVTQRTFRLFKVLSITGEEEAKSFLVKDPEAWESDACYQNLKDRVDKMKVVNDSAERGIALIQKYNETLTKDEDQKQFLLRFVQRHRQFYPSSSKAAMMANDDFEKDVAELE